MMSLEEQEEELRNPLYGELKVERKGSSCNIRDSPNTTSGVSSPSPLNNLSSQVMSLKMKENVLVYGFMHR